MKKILALLFLMVVASACNSADGVTTGEITSPDPVFVTRFPVEHYAALQPEDRPSFTDLRNAAVYKGSVYLAVYGAVVKIDAVTKRILAFSNPALLPQPKHVALQNDTLFIASQHAGSGVVQVNLAAMKIEATYNEATGLKNTQNLKVYNDETYVWVGTASGVGRIDPQTHLVKFYGTAQELNSPCDMNSVRMHVRGAEVWAEVFAHDTCSGAALHYNRDHDTWTRYDVAVFSPTKKRIDFNQFIVSDVGVFAEYQIEHPADPPQENIVVQIKRFDPTTDTWVLIGSASYKDAKAMKLLVLPPEATYMDTIITQAKNDQYTVNADTSKGWITVPFNAPEITIMSITKNPIANNYLIVTPAGLGILGAEDVVPQIVVPMQVMYYSTEDDLHFTADKKFLVVNHEFPVGTGFTGEDENNPHTFIVYDQAAQSGFGFMLPLEKSDEYKPTATKTLVQNGSKLVFRNEYGTFEIDLAAKTVKKTSLP